MGGAAVGAREAREARAGWVALQVASGARAVREAAEGTPAVRGARAVAAERTVATVEAMAGSAEKEATEAAVVLGAAAEATVVAAATEEREAARVAGEGTLAETVVVGHVGMPAATEQAEGVARAKWGEKAVREGSAAVLAEEMVMEVGSVDLAAMGEVTAAVMIGLAEEGVAAAVATSAAKAAVAPDCRSRCNRCRDRSRDIQIPSRHRRTRHLPPNGRCLRRSDTCSVVAGGCRRSRKSSHELARWGHGRCTTARQSCTTN